VSVTHLEVGSVLATVFLWMDGNGIGCGCCRG